MTNKNIPSFKLTFPIIVFLVALAARILFTIFLRSNYFFYDHPSSDVLYYQQWAFEISRINWFGTKTFFGLPLYPYFLATLERLTLGNDLLIRIFHLILGSLNCSLLYFVTCKIFSRKIAQVASLLAATNFTLMYYDWIQLPVSLVIFLSLMIMLAFLSYKNIKTIREWFILGLIIGMTILGDGKFILAAFLLIIYLMFTIKSTFIKTFFRRALPCVLGIILILGITGARNKIIGGDWVWITAQSGLSFFVGNNPSATGVYENPSFIRPTHQGQDQDQIFAAESLSGRRLKPADVSQFWRNQGINFIKNYPSAYLRLLTKKLMLFFTETEAAYDMDLLFLKNIKQKIDYNSLCIVFPLALLGLILSWRNQKTIPMNLLILSQLLFTLIFFLTHKHRTSILPFLLIYQATALCWLWDQIRKGQLKKITLAGVGMISFFLIFQPQKLDSQAIEFLTATKSGPVYEKQRKFEEARKHYFKALAIYPNDTNTLYNLANSYTFEGNISEAQYYYREVLAINPNQIDALYNLAGTYQQWEQYPEAIELYQKILKLDPHSMDTHFQMAKIFETTNNCSSATVHIRKILQFHPHFQPEIQKNFPQCGN